MKKNKAKMYRVSLAMLRPMNYETRVKARSKAEAFAKALELWNTDATTPDAWIDDEPFLGDDLLFLEGDTMRGADAGDFKGIPTGAFIELEDQP